MPGITYQFDPALLNRIDEGEDSEQLRTEIKENVDKFLKAYQRSSLWYEQATKANI